MSLDFKFLKRFLLFSVPISLLTIFAFEATQSYFVDGMKMAVAGDAYQKHKSMSPSPTAYPSYTPTPTPTPTPEPSYTPYPTHAPSYYPVYKPEEHKKFRNYEYEYHYQPVHAPVKHYEHNTYNYPVYSPAPIITPQPVMMEFQCPRGWTKQTSGVATVCVPNNMTQPGSPDNNNQNQNQNQQQNQNNNQSQNNNVNVVATGGSSSSSSSSSASSN